jgi:hypothetical protein
VKSSYNLDTAGRAEDEREIKPADGMKQCVVQHVLLQLTLFSAQCLHPRLTLEFPKKKKRFCGGGGGDECKQLICMHKCKD